MAASSIRLPSFFPTHTQISFWAPKCTHLSFGKSSLASRKGTGELLHHTLKRQEEEESDDEYGSGIDVIEPNENTENELSKDDLKTRLRCIMSNARRKQAGERAHKLRHSLGIDFGDARTGVASSLCGFAPRPIAVVKLQGQKLLSHLVKLATVEKADEFIVGLPRSSDGEETLQSIKTRCFAGRLAQYAAERGWRVYFQDEYGTSDDALDLMIYRGSNQRSRRANVDAYAAVILLQDYFDSGGIHAELLLPKDPSLLEMMWCKINNRTRSL